MMASLLVFAGSLYGNGSPDSCQSTTSVLRLSALHLLRPATYLPSHMILNLKLRYGSRRCVFTENFGMDFSSLYPGQDAWPAFWLIFTTMNSAGLSGAKPTRTLTIPRLMSSCVVVSESHLTKKACDGVEPWKAPRRYSVIMNAVMLSRSWVHKGVSFGSNTAHWMPRYMLTRNMMAVHRSEERRVG